LRCGRNIAYGVARYGLGDTLLQAAETMHQCDLIEFLFGWREDLRDVLRHDPKGYIGHKCMSLATSITDTFPSTEILVAYVAPLTSWFVDHMSSIPPILFRQADITKLAAICDRQFGWGNTVPDRFSTCIWEGAIIRMLCQVSGYMLPYPVRILTTLSRRR
jgi:Holliday junction resolvase YEN1